jgi:hypothetical protein
MLVTKGSVKRSPFAGVSRHDLTNDSIEVMKDWWLGLLSLVVSLAVMSGTWREATATPLIRMS